MVADQGDRGLIPIERELQERLAWFIRLRWYAGLAIIFGAGSILFYLEVSVLPALLVGITVLSYNLLFRLYEQRSEADLIWLKRFAFVQIGADWLALSTLIHFMGGIRSPVSLAYGFHLIIAAILLSRSACYVLTAVASLMYGASAYLANGRDVGVSLVAFIGSSEVGDFWVWLLLTVFFFVTTFLVTSVTGRLREKESALYQSERALDRAYREMEALYQLGQVVNSTLDMQEVLAIIAENATRLLHMKACFIRLFDSSGRRLYIGGHYGLSQAYLEKGPVEVEKSLIDSEALAGGVVQVLEVSEDTRFQYREEARREGLRSVLCVPVSAKLRVLGVIRVYSSIPHHFSDQEISLLKNFANLGAVAIENARSYQELQRLSDQRVWFARMTHHQLRAPLAAIQSALDALPYAGRLSEKQQELVQRARRRIGDAFETIRDLLDLAAAQRPAAAVEVELVSVRDALEGTLESARERAHDKSVDFKVTLPGKEVSVEMHPEDLDRIISNLLDNSVKYTPSGGRVTLDISVEASQMKIRIEDTGIGIEEDLQERIFEGFFRTPSAKATGEMGTGLGLSIVKRLVERWNGRMELVSRPGQGTCFTLTIPVKIRRVSTA